MLNQVKKTKSYFIKVTQSLVCPHSHCSSTTIAFALDCWRLLSAPNRFTV